MVYLLLLHPPPIRSTNFVRESACFLFFKKWGPPGRVLWVFLRVSGCLGRSGWLRPRVQFWFEMAHIGPNASLFRYGLTLWVKPKRVLFLSLRSGLERVSFLIQRFLVA